MIRRLLDVTVFETTGDPTLGDGLLALLTLGAALVALPERTP